MNLKFDIFIEFYISYIYNFVFVCDSDNVFALWKMWSYLVSMAGSGGVQYTV